ncbi:YciI family protein [Paragemmobacter straminiformis]|uniref:YciI family protein n=1 Tax=Paragemmobacter straminiformis TaxID=2045119 RepID=A0A842I4N9_9RHOB|nr:YciI family protein [Gemmobacter straminiformis]MBC2834616.1 YciI family protein [Gemmobacter straminiformis]
MHYVVHCLDHEGAVETRLANYDAHKAYLAAAPVKTVISGPLLADDEQTMIGSCFVLEANSLAEVEDFNRNDPFAKVGLWKTVSIRPFAKRVDNRT